MPTFGKLRELVHNEANTKGDHFVFRSLGKEYADFWDEVNEAEYKHGYTPDYLNPGTPALCDMDLLTESEFNMWVEKFRSFHNKSQQPEAKPVTKKGPPPPIVLPKTKKKKFDN